MKLCMMLLDDSTTIVLSLCALNPAIDGVPAADFHGKVAIEADRGTRIVHLARSRLTLTTAQVYHEVYRAGNK